MDVKKKRIIAIISIVGIVAIVGVLFYTCYHKWNAATCEKPKTCSICKKVEGDSLGHDLLEWKITQESSCSKEGEKAAICSRCNKTITENIDKIEHTPGDWEVKTDYVISPQAIITPGKEVFIVKYKCRKLQTKNVGRCNYIL